MSPEPNGVGRQLPVPLALLVDRVSVQQQLLAGHQLHEPVGPVPFRQMSVAGLLGQVVRRGEAQLVLSATPDHQVAVGNPRVELKGIVAKLMLKGVNQIPGLLRGDVAG